MMKQGNVPLCTVTKETRNYTVHTPVICLYNQKII